MSSPGGFRLVSSDSVFLAEGYVVPRFSQESAALVSADFRTKAGVMQSVQQ